MANYTKTTIGKENRIELHEKLSLTGAEISLNDLQEQMSHLFILIKKMKKSMEFFQVTAKP